MWGEGSWAKGTSQLWASTLTGNHTYSISISQVKHQLSKSDMLADPNQEVLEERTRIQFIRWRYVPRELGSLLSRRISSRETTSAGREMPQSRFGDLRQESCYLEGLAPSYVFK